MISQTRKCRLTREEIGIEVVSGGSSTKKVQNSQTLTIHTLMKNSKICSCPTLMTSSKLVFWAIQGYRRWGTFLAKEQIKFYSEKPFLLKATLILAVGTSYLTDEIRVLSGAYGRAFRCLAQIKQGQGSLSLGLSFQASSGLLVYAWKFPEAKADVEKKTMIDVYKGTLLRTTGSHLKRETSACQTYVIKPYIGYPEELPERCQATK